MVAAYLGRLLKKVETDLIRTPQLHMQLARQRLKTSTSASRTLSATPVFHSFPCKNAFDNGI
jgi:hypothetical protein